MTTQNRLTADEEWNRLPQWIKTIVETRKSCDTHEQAANLTGHTRQTVAKYWKLHRDLLQTPGKR